MQPATSGLHAWVHGARPRTLPAALAPVLVGTGAAALSGGADAVRALLALVVALALQVGVNYANDYSDGIRGTDEVRVGPVRLVGQGLATPGAVKAAAFGFFGVGAVAGLVLVALSGTWWLLVAGGLAIGAAWRYTGGDNPYGYRGLGEVYVFVFFGLMAVLGTEYTQSGRVSLVGVLGAVGIGALASAILVANNLRDIPTDTRHGKRTLAVRLGDGRTRALWIGLVALAFGCVLAMTVVTPWALLGLLAALPAARLALLVRAGASGRDLIPVLAGTGMVELLYAATLFAGLLLAAG